MVCSFAPHSQAAERVMTLFVQAAAEKCDISGEEVLSKPTLFLVAPFREGGCQCLG